MKTLIDYINDYYGEYKEEAYSFMDYKEGDVLECEGYDFSKEEEDHARYFLDFIQICPVNAANCKYVGEDGCIAVEKFKHDSTTEELNKALKKLDSASSVVKELKETISDNSYVSLAELKVAEVQESIAYSEVMFCRS